MTPHDPYADPEPERRPGRTKNVLAIAIPVVVVLAIAALAVTHPWRHDKAPHTAARPSPTAQTATVGQYAGIMSGPIKGMRKDWQDYQANDCDFVALPDSPLCSLLVMGLDISAQTVVTVLTGAVKPGVPAFIGAPPAELTKLVADTLAAAQSVDNVIPDNAPEGARQGWATFVLSLLGEFDRWDPYL